MACCGLVPLMVFLAVGPMLAAGRGVRPYLVSLAGGWGAVLLVALANGPAVVELLENWRDNAAVWIGLGSGLLMSVGMGGLVLWVKAVEDRDPSGRCRRCGYDLRHSPVRCPECGTPVRPDPEQV